MNLLWFLLKESWVMLAIATFTSAISGACSVLLLAVINNALSHGQIGNHQLFWSFAGLIGITFCTSLTSQLVLANMSQQAIYQLRLRLSSWILSCPLRHLETLGANRLMATLVDDTLSIGFAVFNLPFLCTNLSLTIGCLVYLGWLSWFVCLGTIVFLFGAIVIVQLLIAKAVSFMKLAREEQDRLFQHFRAITDGIKELKLHRARRQAFLTEELQVTAAALRDHRIAGLGFSAIASSSGQLLFFILLAIIVFGLPQVIPVTSPVLSGYVLTLTFLTRPLQSILETLPNLSQASVALQKVEALGLSLASHAENSSQLQFPSHFHTYKIELVQLIHTYRTENSDSFTLGPIDLTLQPGELVFIAGGNGSGKSTLAKLITGLYIPEQGEIRLNGVAIADHNREAYRQLFTAVFSDFYLFERVLGLYLDDLDALAKDYLHQLQLAHKVKVNQGVLSTINLSQGQRKRLALLTAYLEDRPLYLFDEWASDQDPYFREIFYEQILWQLKQRGKTVLVISHDERYFHLADRVVKLDYGKLV